MGWVSREVDPVGSIRGMPNVKVRIRRPITVALRADLIAMVPLTRRRLLQSTVGLAAGLAGCNGVDSMTSSRSSSTPAERDGSPSTDSTTDPETVRVRGAGDRWPVWLADLDGNDGRPTPGEHSRHEAMLVDSRARAERVEIADGPAGERARSFLAETSFDRETIYVENHRVRECFRLELCSKLVPMTGSSTHCCCLAPSLLGWSSF